jgi:hypothetical protein
MRKIKINPIKAIFNLTLIRSFKIIKNKDSRIKIIKKIKKKNKDKRLTNIFGSFFKFIVRKDEEGSSFKFFSVSLSSWLPSKFKLIKTFEIINKIKNKNNETKIIIPNAVKLEM